MEESILLEQEKFKTEVGKHIGKIVHVKYYDENRSEEKTVVERVVMSEVTPHHLMVITAFGDSLIKRGLAISKIEFVASEGDQEVIFNSSYDEKNISESKKTM